MSSYFSRPAVRGLEPRIRTRIESLCQRLRQAQETGELTNLTHAYAALTVDIISEYSFQKSFNHLDEHDYAPHVQEMTLRFAQAMLTIAHLPWLTACMNCLPLRLRDWIKPDVSQMVEANKMFRQLVLDFQEQ